MSVEFDEKHVYVPWAKLSYIGYVDDDKFCEGGDCIDIKTKKVYGKTILANEERQKLETGSGRPAWEAVYVDVETNTEYKILLLAELQEGLYTVYKCRHFNGTYFVKEAYNIDSHGVSPQNGSYRQTEKGIPWGRTLKGKDSNGTVPQRAFVVTDPGNRGGCSPHGFVDTGIDPNNPETVGDFDSNSAYCQNFIGSLGSNQSQIPYQPPQVSQTTVRFGSYDDIVDMLGGDQSYRFTTDFAQDYEWIKPLTNEAIESIAKTFLTTDRGSEYYKKEMQDVLSKLKSKNVKTYVVKRKSEASGFLYSGEYRSSSNYTQHFIMLEDVTLRLATSSNWQSFINGSLSSGGLDLDNYSNARNYVGPKHEDGWLFRYYFLKVAVMVAQNYMTGSMDNNFGFFSNLKSRQTLENWQYESAGSSLIRVPSFVSWREAFQREGGAIQQEGLTGLAQYGVLNDLDAARWADRDAHYVGNRSSNIDPPSSKAYAQSMVPLEETIRQWEADYLAASGQVLSAFSIADLALGGHNSSGVDGWSTAWGVRLDKPDKNYGSNRPNRYDIVDYEIYPKEGLDCNNIDPTQSTNFHSLCTIDNA